MERINIYIHGSLQDPATIRQLSEQAIMSESDEASVIPEVKYYLHHSSRVGQRGSPIAQEVIAIVEEGEDEVYGVVVDSEFSTDQIGKDVTVQKEYIQKAYSEDEEGPGIWITKERPDIRRDDQSPHEEFITRS